MAMDIEQTKQEKAARKEEEKAAVLPNELLQPKSGLVSPVEIPDTYHELELTQVIERINSFDNFQMQGGIFLGSVHFGLLGAAFTTQKAGIIFLAPVMIIVSMMLYSSTAQTRLVYYFRGLQLQKRYAPQDEETFLRLLTGTTASEARRIATLESTEKRKAALQTPWWIFREAKVWVALVIAVLELARAFVLWLVFNWSLF
jgi:hypothetical protein